MKIVQQPTVKGSCTKKECEEYASQRKDWAIKNIQTILTDSKVQNGEISFDEHEDYCEPLSISREILVEIQLSTGGDADGFKLIFDEYYTVMKGVYYWADWGVYEEVQLSDEELETVESLYNISDWLSGL
ncbi:MAG: hypothetical protein ABI758_05585 [Candidatus Woesebacteria bacterium]